MRHGLARRPSASTFALCVSLAAVSSLVLVCAAPAAAHPGDNKDVATECAKPAGCVLDAKARLSAEPWADAAFAPACDALRVCYATRTKTKSACDVDLDAKLKTACASASKDAATCARVTDRYREALVRDGARTHPALQQCARNVTLGNIKSDAAALGAETRTLILRVIAPKVDDAAKYVASTKATVDADANAIKAANARIFDLAGMTYTPPVNANGTTASPTPVAPKLSPGAACAMKLGTAQQLCNLAEAARPLADRAHTQAAAVVTPLLVWRDELDVAKENWLRRRSGELGDPGLRMNSKIEQREAQGPVDEVFTQTTDLEWKALYQRFLSDATTGAADYADTYHHNIVTKASPITTAFAADRAKAAELQRQAESIVAESKRARISR